MKKQNLLIILIIFSLLVMLIGYSVFKMSTNIRNVMTSNSDINVEFKIIGKIYESGSVGADAVISKDRKIIFINIPKLTYQGAYVIIPIMVENVGATPVRLSSIYEYDTKDSDTIKVYYDGIAVTDKVLNPGDVEEFRVKVIWENKQDNKPIKMNFYLKLNYVQE